jgi:hypothetical protein
MEEEQIASGSEAGAGENTQSQEAQSTTQVEGESLTSEGTQKVGGVANETPSTSKPGRSNIDWALQRQIEKVVKKSLQASLQEQLTPYLESLKSQNPPATKSQTEEQPDYNNLSQWLQSKVNALLDERFQKDIPKTLNQFKTEVTSEFQSKGRVQEARNYLYSQKDIGRDETKLAEVRQVMEDYQIDVAADPIRASEIAVELWRSKKTNPNAPPKSHLTTVSGGAGTQVKREPSIKELQDLQDKISSGSLTIEEQEKLGKQIESLVFSK